MILTLKEFEKIKKMSSGGLNLEKAIEQLSRGEILPQATVKEICERLKEQFVEESNVVSLRAPISVVGDIHGFKIITFRID